MSIQLPDPLTEALSHPLTAVLSFLAAGMQLVFGAFDPAWSLISATASIWFPTVAVTAGTILPELGLPDLGTTILLLAASVFVAVQLDRLTKRVQTWYDNR